MDISRDNYEFFLINYIDGNLSADQVKAVEAFLLLNPDLNSEFENISNHILIPDNQTYKDKLLLKKFDYSLVDIHNEFDYLCVASVEKDINVEESRKLNRLIYDSNFMKTEYDQFHKTKLKPNTNIKFQPKAKLKRFTLFEIKRLHIVSFSTGAALVLLFFGLFSYFNSSLGPINNSPIVLQIEIEPKNNFPKPSYELIHPQLGISKNEVDVASAPVQKSIKMNVDVDYKTSEPPTEAQKRTKIAYLEHRNLVVTVTPKSSEITIPPLYIDETTENEVQIAHIPANVNRTIGLYEFVQFGVNLLGKASGTELKLEGTRNEMGKLKRIQLESDLFALSLPVNQKK